MGKSGTEAAIEYLDKLLKDPEEWKKFEEAYELEAIAEENKLICAVACEDPRYRLASVGDMLGYGMDHDYYTKLEHRAMDLFYQFHGNGD